MPDLRLEDLVLYKLLQRRKGDSNATVLLGLLQLISSDARAHLEFIRSSFPSYTDHSLQHSFRIANAVGSFLNKRAQKELGSVEIFAFLMAAMFHDVGMVADDGKSANQVRPVHPLRSSEFIKRYLTERLNIISEVHSRLGTLLAFVVESHGMTWEEMEARDEFQRPQMIMREIVRPSLLAILLRLGDLLDLDYERSPGSVRRCTPSFSQDKTSRLHHDRHGHVTNFYVSPQQIRVFVESHSREESQLWDEWFGYIRQDIERANTQVFRNELESFRLPSHELKNVPRWEIPTLEFGDYSQVLDKIVADSPVDVELLGSIGEGDFLTPWLKRMQAKTAGKPKRLRLRCLADAVIDEQFSERTSRERFKERLGRNLQMLSEICQQRGIELVVGYWWAPAPFHGFICGDDALVGEWVRGEDGVPHVNTALKHIQRSRHPKEFAECLNKFEHHRADEKSIRLSGPSSREDPPSDLVPSVPMLRLSLPLPSPQMSREEKGELLWNYAQTGQPVRELDFSYAQVKRRDFRKASLAGANLQNADFYKSDLTGANLDDADLSWAYLSETDFSQASLVRTNLSRARLSGTCFLEAVLKDTNLTKARVTVDTYTRSRWTPEKLSEFQKRGIEIADLQNFPAEARHAILAPIETLPPPQRPAMPDELAIDFAILTAIDVERRAVCTALGLTDNHRVKRGTRVYWRTRLQFEEDNFYEIVVAQSSDVANVDAAILTNDTVHHWAPRAALFVGIAASVAKELRLGDVAVGKEVYYYERGKTTPEGVKPEPYIISADSTLWNNVVAVPEWKGDLLVKRPDGADTLPKVYRGVIASGEKVLADAAARDHIASGHRKMIAIEMEGYGFSRAIWQCFETVKHLVIRGISDDGSQSKNDEWHAYAAAAAAAFAVHFLHDKPLPPRASKSAPKS